VIRVELPAGLRQLARVNREVTLDALPGPAGGPVTQRAILDAIEARYPVLRGAIRDQVTGRRRPLVRFFACQRDVSHESPDAPLPEAVATGAEPFLIIGAIAGG
jgi:molybdopterin synthase sulfur carrier subunit